MAVLRFDNDDAAYLLWLDHNPNGYVINTKRIIGRGTAMLHTARCTHIRAVRNSDVAGGFTQREWIKICANDSAVLIQHYATVSSAPMVTLVRCRSCTPVPSDLTFERVHLADHRPLSIKSDQSFLNAREVDPYLRAICLEHHGTRCAACGVDMGVRYGALGKGFMEVHDTRRPGKDSPGRSFDPRKDLVPVCPNCHAMVHRGRKVPLTIDELRKVIRRALIGWGESIY
jgi:hypothetical protein